MGKEGKKIKKSVDIPTPMKHLRESVDIPNPTSINATGASVKKTKTTSENK